MNLLITPYNWRIKSGGEVYLHRLCTHLLAFGHSIKCICDTPEPYTDDLGIECYPQGDMVNCFTANNDLFEWADIVFHQLIGNAYAYNKCRQHNKRNVFIAHNFANFYYLTDKSSVVYNSHHMASLGLFNAPSTVLQPLVDYRDYKPSTGSKIALINCNENKGGRLFMELSRRLRQYDFVGYFGNYDEQITGGYVDYKTNGVIDWSEIGLLLVPSLIESWSQVATEAICCGIPVACSLLPCLSENLSYAGLYASERTVDCYEGIINTVMGNEATHNSFRELSLKRAIELDPIPRVKDFNEWLCNLV